MARRKKCKVKVIKLNAKHYMVYAGPRRSFYATGKARAKKLAARIRARCK